MGYNGYWWIWNSTLESSVKPFWRTRCTIDCRIRLSHSTNRIVSRKLSPCLSLSLRRCECLSNRRKWRNTSGQQSKCGINSWVPGNYQHQFRRYKATFILRKLFRWRKNLLQVDWLCCKNLFSSWRNVVWSRESLDCFNIKWFTTFEWFEYCWWYCDHLECSDCFVWIINCFLYSLTNFILITGYRLLQGYCGLKSFYR